MQNQFPFTQLIIMVVLFKSHTGNIAPQATSFLTNVEVELSFLSPHLKC